MSVTDIESISPSAVSVLSIDQCRDRKWSLFLFPWRIYAALMLERKDSTWARIVSDCWDNSLDACKT